MTTLFHRRTRIRAAAMAAVVASAAALWPGPGAAQTAFSPAAVVNDDVITFYDVEQRVGLMRMTGGEGGEGAARAALEALIDDRLRKQAGEQFQIEASDEAIAAGLAEFGGRMNVDGATLLTRAASFGASEDAVLDLVRSQVVWRDLVRRRFGPRATPTEIELDQEIELAASGQSRSFRLSEIVLGTTEGRADAARRQMDRILSELRAGGDFAALARRFGGTPSARNGGDVGWVPETALPPDLADLIASTPKGGVTRPVEVPGGLSIIRVADSREDAPAWARDAQVSLRRIAISGEGDDAMAEARAIRDGASGCDGIPDLSDEAVMESIDRKLVNALPAPIRGAVRLLQAGQASDPIRTDDGVEVFVVCDRSGGVDAETRARLRDQIRTQRLARFAEGYLQELRRDAVIERR